MFKIFTGVLISHNGQNRLMDTVIVVFLCSRLSQQLAITIVSKVAPLKLQLFLIFALFKAHCKYAC